MKLSEYCKKLNAELLSQQEQGRDPTVVLRSDEFGYEPVSWLESLTHDNEECLLVD